MIYRCIETFSIDLVDGDDLPTGETIMVHQDSLWNFNNKNNKFDGEIHLDNCEDKSEWIEIDRKFLRDYFEIDDIVNLEAQFVRRLNSCKVFDSEGAHSDADRLLLEALRTFGYGAIADAYEAVESEVTFHRA